MPMLAEYHPDAYLLGPGDELRIVTYDEDQLTSNFVVNDRGNVTLPLIGGMHAAGTTTDQFASAVEEQLMRRKLLKNPSVSVEVRTYRPIFVLGEVAKPGQYPYQPGMTMLTAVAIAGGFTYRAEKDYASVVRTDAGHAETGKVVAKSFLSPGDVINVYGRYF